MEQSITTRVAGKKRGTVVPFSQLTNTQELHLPTWEPSDEYPSLTSPEYGGICPYTPLIPLWYVAATPQISRMGNPDADYKGAYMKALFGSPPKENWDKCWDNILHHPHKDLIMAGYEKGGRDPKSIMGEFKGILHDFLCFDQGIRLAGKAHELITTKEATTTVFRDGSYGICSFQFRTYGGLVSPYSIYIKNDRQRMCPHILAVVRIEDLVYQRLHLLLHKCFDESKVIVLVDNRVDGLFPYPAFKGYYKDQLEPVLREGSCPVFRVPHEYILENTQIKPFKIQERNIIKRKQAISSTIDSFYNTYGIKEPPASVVPPGYQVVADSPTYVTYA